MAKDWVARITIHDLPKMTKAGRKKIASWLRKSAATVEKTDGEKFNHLFRFTYYSTKK